MDSTTKAQLQARIAALREELRTLETRLRAMDEPQPAAQYMNRAIRNRRRAQRSGGFANNW